MIEKSAVADAAAAPGFEEKAFFEYHLYTLGRPATIPNNSTKQIELFDSATRVPAKKQLVYYGARFRRLLRPADDGTRDGPVRRTRRSTSGSSSENDKASGMGMPLPAGRIRVSQQDKADGSLEFIGEDTINHTPKDEDVRVKLGTAFDVVGERRQTDFVLNTKGRVMEEAFEIKVRNHKEQAVEVIGAREPLSLEPVVARRAVFALREEGREDNGIPGASVAADGEAVITYRVRYTW